MTVRTASPLLQLGRALCVALLLAASLAIGATAAAQSRYGLPDGWVEAEPHEGRLAAMLHSESLTRMEGWRVKLGQEDLDRFHSQLERRLKGKGFQLDDTSETTIDGYPARITLWSRSFRGKAFTLQIVELYRRGEMWQFSSMYREGAEAIDWEAALMTFAKALLS
ncbi:MAG: hypothetical protein CMH57_01540 [Myxococcales bacterium]|nr:hypothetical protein [Myxococcales bacterium]